MASTLQQILLQAEELVVNTGGAARTIPAPALEILLPVVLRKIILDARRSEPARLKFLRKSSTLNFVNGQANLPARIIPEFFDETELFGTDANTSAEISGVTYFADYADFVNDPFAGSGIGSYTIKDGKILAQNIPGETAQPTAGAFNFYYYEMPLISSNPTAQINIEDGMTRELVVELARAMRGEAPYQNLGEEEKDK